MPPPMTPAPRTPTRPILRGFTAPTPSASTPVSFLTSSIRKKSPTRLRIVGVPMSVPTPSTSYSRALANGAPKPFSTTESAARGAG